MYMRQETRDKSQNGQLLVELMVAMSLMMIGLLGIFAVLSQSLGLSRVAANQYIAANLAAEGIEVTKNILDKNFINGDQWNLGFQGNGDYAVEFDSTSLIGDENTINSPLRYDETTRTYNYSVGRRTNFVRKIIIENVGPTEIKVTSKVEWKDRGGIDFEMEVEDRFRSWRESL